MIDKKSAEWLLDTSLWDLKCRTPDFLHFLDGGQVSTSVDAAFATGEKTHPRRGSDPRYRGESTADQEEVIMEIQEEIDRVVPK